jgi:hypothetical protein
MRGRWDRIARLTGLTFLFIQMQSPYVGSVALVEQSKVWENWLVRASEVSLSAAHHGNFLVLISRRELLPITSFISVDGRLHIITRRCTSLRPSGFSLWLVGLWLTECRCRSGRRCLVWCRCRLGVDSVTLHIPQCFSGCCENHLSSGTFCAVGLISKSTLCMVCLRRCTST